MLQIKVIPKLIDRYYLKRMEGPKTQMEVKYIYDECAELYKKFCGFTEIDARMRMLNLQLDRAIKSIDELLGRA